jgi:hypothetical protein
MPDDDEIPQERQEELRDLAWQIVTRVENVLPADRRERLFIIQAIEEVLYNLRTGEWKQAQD